MLTAKKVLSRLWQRERRKQQRGDWREIGALRERGMGDAVWRKLRLKTQENFGNGLLEMLEAGIREVAQTGFLHDEVSSRAWAEELEAFRHIPEIVPDAVMNSPELWKLQRGKATGEDGWCEELLMLLRK